MPKFKHHVFVCMNERDKSASRPSCAHHDGKKLKGLLKDAVKDAGLKGKVRINESGCLDQCEHGAVIAVYPDEVWYGFVDVIDIGEIVQQHLVKGVPVERLRLADACLNTDHCRHRET